MDSTTYTRAGVTVASNDPTVDGVDAYLTSLRNLAAWANTNGAMYAQGLLSARPAFGKAGRFYRATDDATGVIYYDDGTQWQSIGASPPTDGTAATPSLRTLGAGAQQAAAGNHSHGATTPTYVYKTSDTSQSSTTTPADDPHLTSTLAVGTWQVDVDVIVGASASSNGGILLKWTFGGTATTRMQAVQAPSPTLNTYGNSTLNLSSTASNTAGWGIGLYTVDTVARFRFVLVVTGSGTFTIQWAQNSSNAASSIVRAGSQLVATRLA